MTGFYSTTSPASLTGRIRFFWLLENTAHRKLPWTTVLSRSHLPFQLRWKRIRHRPEYEPRGAKRHSFTSPASGKSSGGRSDRPELQAPSPRRSLPLLQLPRSYRPASRIRVSPRAG